eukprot:1182857-Prorocentrum_minimum.AAC.2
MACSRFVRRGTIRRVVGSRALAWSVLSWKRSGSLRPSDWFISSIFWRRPIRMGAQMPSSSATRTARSTRASSPSASTTRCVPSFVFSNS